MKSTKVRTPAESKDTLLSNVALLYYGEGLNQGEIARRIKVSRATVVSMLKECRDKGIVDIRVNGQYLTGSGLAKELIDKFQLNDVYIAQLGDDETFERDFALRQLSRVASAAILHACEPGDRVGVAWGETVFGISEAMPSAPIKGVEVSQLIGSMSSTRVPASETCAIQIANKLGAECYTLHAPAMVSNVQLANDLKAEPTIKTQLKRLENLDLIITSIGHVQNTTHVRAANMISKEELNNAKKAGAVGIICCQFIDADGQEVKTPSGDKLIAAKLDSFRKPEKRILAVTGDGRTEATVAAIKGGFVSHLCVDEKLARAVLEVDS